jgi:hypothetical protein
MMIRAGALNKKGVVLVTASAATLMSGPTDVTAEEDEMWRKIAAWDLSRERLYLKNRLGYESRGFLSAMETEYKRFMFLIAVYRDLEIPMAERLDDMWHVAVLHTRNYTAFCQEVFGGYIHHNPTVSDEENTALWPAYLANTLALYEKHFGAPAEEFWDRKDPKTPCCTH